MRNKIEIGDPVILTLFQKEGEVITFDYIEVLHIPQDVGDSWGCRVYDDYKFCEDNSRLIYVQNFISMELNEDWIKVDTQGK